MRQLTGLVLALAALSLAGCLPAAAAKPYPYPQWGFTVSFLAPPTVKDTPATPDGKPHSVLLESMSGGRDFAISITDVTDPSRDIDTLTDAAGPLMAKVIDGQPGTRTYAATPEGVMGRELTIDKGGQPQMKTRLFVAGGRFYVLVAKSIFGVTDTAVDDFLTSFHTVDKNGAPTNGT